MAFVEHAVAFDPLWSNAESIYQDYEAAYGVSHVTEPTGVVTYEGVGIVNELISAETGELYSLVGRATVELNFSNDKFSTEIDEFYEVVSNPIVALDDGVDLSASETTAVEGRIVLNYDTGVLSGQVSKSDGELATYSVGLEDVEAWGENEEIFEGGGRGTSRAAGRDDRNVTAVFLTKAQQQP